MLQPLHQQLKESLVSVLKALTFITLTLPTLSIAGELIGDNDELPVTLQSLLENSGRENLIELMQLGSLNQAYISQTGAMNTVLLEQAGVNNTAEIIQLGTNNEVDLLQSGADNQASITQVGDGNLVELNQLGNADFSIEQIADDSVISITQY